MQPKSWVDDAGLVHRTKVDRQGGACGKFNYSSKKLALATARQQRVLTGENITAYHCYRCHAFHIGHPPGQPRFL